MLVLYPDPGLLDLKLHSFTNIRQHELVTACSVIWPFNFPVIHCILTGHTAPLSQNYYNINVKYLTSFGSTRTHTKIMSLPALSWLLQVCGHHPPTAAQDEGSHRVGRDHFYLAAVLRLRLSSHHLHRNPHFHLLQWWHSHGVLPQLPGWLRWTYGLLVGISPPHG